MTSATTPSAEPALVVAHYETLRRVALGEGLPPEARAGLMLFLRRGLWGWARAVATLSTVQPPTSAAPAHGKRPEEYRTLIHIFAALASKATPEEQSHE